MVGRIAALLKHFLINSIVVIVTLAAPISLAHAYYMPGASIGTDPDGAGPLDAFECGGGATNPISDDPTTEEFEPREHCVDFVGCREIIEGSPIIGPNAARGCDLDGAGGVFTAARAQGFRAWISFDHTYELDNGDPVGLVDVFPDYIDNAPPAPVVNINMWNAGEPIHIADFVTTNHHPTMTWPLNSRGDEEIITFDDGNTIKFSLEREGDEYCFYATPNFPLQTKSGDLVIERFKIGTTPPQTLDEVYELVNLPEGGAAVGTGADSRDHCIKAPFALSAEADTSRASGNDDPSNATSLLNDVCFDFGLAVTNNDIPMLTAAIQCIEGSMRTIFIRRTSAGGSNTDALNYFWQMRNNVKDLVLALIGLVVIFWGFNMMLLGRSLGNLKRGDWLWLPIKVCLVLYFAIDVPMDFIFMWVWDGSKELTFYFVRAIIASSDAAGGGGHLFDNRYNYCNYFDVTSLANYDVPQLINNVTNVPQTYAVWDTIDCRILKYFGVGYHSYDPTAINRINGVPQVLFLGASSVFATGMGLPILFLTVIYLIFLLQVVTRFAHVYIMAFLAYVLLFYISPIVIPLALFETTKGIFMKWVRMILSLAIQPILLITFLMIFLNFVDAIFYGGNRDFGEFGTADPPNIATDATPVADRTNLIAYNAFDGTADVRGGGARRECDDTESLACLLATTTISRRPLIDAKVFEIFEISEPIFSVAGQDRLLFMQLLLMCALFLLFSMLLGVMEETSKTLSGGAFPGGAVGMSNVTASSPVTTGISVAKTSISSARSVGEIGSNLAYSGSRTVLSTGFSVATLPVRLLRRGRAKRASWTKKSPSRQRRPNSRGNPHSRGNANSKGNQQSDNESSE